MNKLHPPVLQWSFVIGKWKYGRLFVNHVENPRSSPRWYHEPVETLHFSVFEKLKTKLSFLRMLKVVFSLIRNDQSRLFLSLTSSIWLQVWSFSIIVGDSVLTTWEALVHLLLSSLSVWKNVIACSSSFGCAFFDVQHSIHATEQVTRQWNYEEMKHAKSSVTDYRTLLFHFEILLTVFCNLQFSYLLLSSAFGMQFCRDQSKKKLMIGSHINSFFFLVFTWDALAVVHRYIFCLMLAIYIQ